jgi:regulator of replication initiation timing
MELFARLENIEFHINQLKQKCNVLQTENDQLRIENKDLERQIYKTTQELHGLEETNKITKLAQSTSPSADNTALKQQIDQIIKEIDQCLILVKQ